MYQYLLETPTGRFVQSQVSAPEMVQRLMEKSDKRRPAVEALTGALPSNLPNSYKRLAGYLVKRVLQSRGYRKLPGSWPCLPGSLFKRGARYERYTPVNKTR